MCVFLVDTEHKGGTTVDSSHPKSLLSSVPAHNPISSPSSENFPHPSAESQPVASVNENLSTHKTSDESPHTQSVHQAENSAVPHSLEEPISHNHHSPTPETMSSENKHGTSELDQFPPISSAVAGTDHTLNPEISTYQSDEMNIITKTDIKMM